MGDGMVTIREAAEIWGVTKPTISAKLDQLEGSGALGPGHVHKGAGKGGATLLDRDALHALAGVMGPAGTGAEAPGGRPEAVTPPSPGQRGDEVRALLERQIGYLEWQVSYLDGQIEAKDARIATLEGQVAGLQAELGEAQAARAAEAIDRAERAEGGVWRRLFGRRKLLGDGTGAAKSQ